MSNEPRIRLGLPGMGVTVMWLLCLKLLEPFFAGQHRAVVELFADMSMAIQFGCDVGASVHESGCRPGPAVRRTRRLVLDAVARRSGVRRTPPAPGTGRPQRRDRHRHRTRAAGPSQGAAAELRVPRRRSRRPAPRTRTTGARLCAGALGCRGQLVRGRAPTGALPAQSVPPRRLPAHEPRAARGRRGQHAGGHRRHDDRVRDLVGAAAVRRSRTGSHRPVAPDGHHELLQLQRGGDILGRRHRRHRGRGHRVELSRNRCRRPCPSRAF